MSSATQKPEAGMQGPHFKTALLGFVISNVVLTAAMVLLGSVAG